MIRTRFAPSPTGYLHVGGLRTALYAFLFARKNKGKFILRIEDTDQAREVAGAAGHLMKMLKFFDLEYDEGPDKDGPHAPYTQSQRVKIHQEHAHKLLESGHSYRCFCSKEELDQMRAEQTRLKKPPMYDKRCRHLSEEEIIKKLESDTPFVIRQKIPENRTIIFDDLIRGRVEVRSHTIDDQVIIKSDGFPTYHLANVVDDHLMEVSHVIRAEEWLPSTPKHLLLYEAFAWKPPEFAHLPLLLNPDKSKLSKRQGDVAAEDYLQKGYLKAAIINFIAFLGWNPGGGEQQEIFTLPELIDRFSLEQVQKAGAIFNIDKLDWVNAIYIRKMPITELTEAIIPHLDKQDWFKKTPYAQLTKEHLKYLESAVSLEQERLQHLDQAPEMLKFFLTDKLEYDAGLFIHEKMKVDQEIALSALENSLPALEALEDYQNEEKIQQTLSKIIEKMELKNGQVLWPLRVALTGEKFSPGVFEVAKVLGKEKTLERVKASIEILKKSAYDAS